MSCSTHQPNRVSLSDRLSLTSRVQHPRRLSVAELCGTLVGGGGALQNIKELNAHRQTREETLRKAADIFGTDNGDLYASFESLLSRHLPL